MRAGCSRERRFSDGCASAQETGVRVRRRRRGAGGGARRRTGRVGSGRGGARPGDVQPGHRAHPAARLSGLPPARFDRPHVAAHLRGRAAVGALHQGQDRPRTAARRHAAVVCRQDHRHSGVQERPVAEPGGDRPDRGLGRQRRAARESGRPAAPGRVQRRLDHRDAGPGAVEPGDRDAGQRLRLVGHRPRRGSDRTDGGPLRLGDPDEGGHALDGGRQGPHVGRRALHHSPPELLRPARRRRQPGGAAGRRRRRDARGGAQRGRLRPGRGQADEGQLAAGVRQRPPASQRPAYAGPSGHRVQVPSPGLAAEPHHPAARPVRQQHEPGHSPERGRPEIRGVLRAPRARAHRLLRAAHATRPACACASTPSTAPG